MLLCIGQVWKMVVFQLTFQILGHFHAKPQIMRQLHQELNVKIFETSPGLVEIEHRLFNKMEQWLVVLFLTQSFTEHFGHKKRQARFYYIKRYREERRIALDLGNAMDGVLLILVIHHQIEQCKRLKEGDPVGFGLAASHAVDDISLDTKGFRVDLRDNGRLLVPDVAQRETAGFM